MFLPKIVSACLHLQPLAGYVIIKYLGGVIDELLTVDFVEIVLFSRKNDEITFDLGLTDPELRLNLKKLCLVL